MYPLSCQPPQFKVDPRLAKLLGGLTQGTRQQIISALWTYIKEHRLLDAADRQFINCDQYLTPVITASYVLHTFCHILLQCMVISPLAILFSMFAVYIIFKSY